MILHAALIVGLLSPVSVPDTASGPESLLPPGVVLPPPQCEPLIRGALWWIHPGTDGQNLDRLLEAMDKVGMNILWLLNTMALAADPEDTLLERIYRQADARGWRVIIETSLTPRWYGPWDIPALKKLEEERIELVARRYAQHPSFYGWYINYEIYMEWDEKSDKIRELYNHIGRLTRTATPEAKLTISPFFLADPTGIRGDFRYAEPQEYAEWWTQTIREAGIDIVMLQDSGAEHCNCVPVETRVAFFAAMHRACRAAGAELWGNVETVEYLADDWQDFARKYRHHRETGTVYPWSFDMERNAFKLDLASRFSTNLVTWGWEFWNPVVPQDQFGNSQDNYNAYQAYYNRISSERVSEGGESGEPVQP